MIRVGLIGEDPNDTASIKNLLEKQYKRSIQIYPLVRTIKSTHLDTDKVKRSLLVEFTSKKCDFVICIRDLDAFATNKVEMRERQKWFNELNALVKGKGLFLLNIWELEALILGDIQTFNSIYKANFNFTGDPSLQDNPKEKLKRATSKLNKKFHESHCPEIFKKLDIEMIKSKCVMFNKFTQGLERKILPSKEKKRRTAL